MTYWEFDSTAGSCDSAGDVTVKNLTQPWAAFMCTQEPEQGGSWEVLFHMSDLIFKKDLNILEGTQRR